MREEWEFGEHNCLSLECSHSSLPKNISCSKRYDFMPSIATECCFGWVGVVHPKMFSFPTKSCGMFVKAPFSCPWGYFLFERGMKGQNALFSNQWEAQSRSNTTSQVWRVVQRVLRVSFTPLCMVPEGKYQKLSQGVSQSQGIRCVWLLKIKPRACKKK